MKNLKLTIDKGLKKIPMDRLVIRQKEFTEDIRFINKGLTASVLFKDLTILTSNKQMLAKNLKAGKIPDLSIMPFEDYCVVTDVDVLDGEEISNEPNTHLIRLTRSRFSPKIVIVTTYMVNPQTGLFVTIDFKAVDTSDNTFELIGYDKRFKEIVYDELQEHIQNEMANVFLIYTAIMSFEPVKIGKPLTFSERKHVPSGVQDKYIEYTLDLSKPSIRYKFKSIRTSTGTHNSPCEHLRRGHYRTYKSGKKVWVNGITVNKGSKSGKVEKDYSM